MLHEKDVKAPPRSSWPAGVSLPPSAAPSQVARTVPPKDTGGLENAIPSAKKATADKEVEEVSRFTARVVLVVPHAFAGPATIRLPSIRGVAGAEVASGAPS